MRFTEKLRQAYFNLIYNPLYDFTTARLNRYQQLQQRCIGKFEFKDSDTVLCVGLGTGNEVLHILKANGNVSVTGVDYSDAALRKAYTKALALGKKIRILNMDARYLEFPAGSFDKVLCIHVMDFVEDCQRVTDEIFRVLKDEGQFVLTYPSDKEGIKLGSNLLKDNLRTNFASDKNRVNVIINLIPRMLMVFICLPQMAFIPKKNVYPRRELKSMLAQLTDGGFQIEEEPIYQDFIVYGKKTAKGGKPDAPRR